MSQSESSARSRASHGATSTSRSLLVRLKEQDADAWGRLVTLYTPLVFHWCQKIGLATDEIPDVVQEVFKSVAEHIDRFRKERPQDTFRGWLRVITRNKAYDAIRRLGKNPRAAGGSIAMDRMAAVPAVDDADQSEVDALDADDSEAKSIIFHGAMELIRADFQPRTWQAFWRVVVDDCTPAEIADELGMSAGAVRVAKCRVLQRLRQELIDRDD